MEDVNTRRHVQTLAWTAIGRDMVRKCAHLFGVGIGIGIGVDSDTDSDPDSDQAGM